MKKDVVVYVLSGGQWVETTRMKIENPASATKEDIQYAIDQLHNLFYKGDKVQLTDEYNSVTFRGLDKNFAAFKVVAE